MTAELLVVMTTCPPDRAQEIADLLVNGRLAACVQALPGVRSTYRWEGEIQHDHETLLLVKVPREGLDACVQALEQAHPYAVPEVVVLAAQSVGRLYLEWAKGQIR